MKIAIAQINPFVGDIQGNSKIILNACNRAYEQGTNLLLTPELSLWGYPPRDLLLNPLLLEEQKNILEKISQTINAEFKAFFLKPLDAIISKKILLSSLANFLVIKEFIATTPPKALTGSHASAFLKDLI